MSGDQPVASFPRPISEDSSFRHIDSLPVPGVGLFDLLLRNSQPPKWILAKKLEAQKRPQQQERAAILNKIAGNFPPEITAANSEYKPLAEPKVKQETKNLFADPKTSNWNYFEHSGANLLEVTNHFSKQGTRYSDSDLFSIAGFLVDAGRKLEDVLGHHSLITQSSLLVKPDGKLSLLNPFVNDTQINATDINLVSKILECGPNFTQEMYLTRDARKAAEKNDPRIKAIGAWHRGEIMTTIDHSFITLLSLVAGVDDKNYFKDAREYSQEEVAKTIENLRKQGANSMLLDFLQHVLLQQAYDSFKKLSQYITTNPPLQSRIQTEYSKNVLTSSNVQTDPQNAVVQTVHHIQASNVNTFAPNQVPAPAPPVNQNLQNFAGTQQSIWTQGGTVSTQEPTGKTVQNQMNSGFAGQGQTAQPNAWSLQAPPIQQNQAFQNTSNLGVYQNSNAQWQANTGTQPSSGILSNFTHNTGATTQTSTFHQTGGANAISSQQTQTQQQQYSTQPTQPSSQQQLQANTQLNDLSRFLAQQASSQSTAAARQIPATSPSQSFGFAAPPVMNNSTTVTYNNQGQTIQQGQTSQQGQTQTFQQGQIQNTQQTQNQVFQQQQQAGQAAQAQTQNTQFFQQTGGQTSSSSGLTLPLALPLAPPQSTTTTTVTNTNTNSTAEAKFYAEQVEILKKQLAQEQLRQQQAEQQFRVQNEALVRAHTEAEQLRKQQAQDREYMQQQLLLKTQEAERKALEVAEAQARAFAQSQLQQSQAHQQALQQAQVQAEQEAQRKAFAEAELKQKQQHQQQSALVIQEQRNLEAQLRANAEIQARLEVESRAAQIKIEAERNAQATAQARFQAESQAQIQAKLEAEARFSQQTAPLAHTSIQTANMAMVPMFYMPVNTGHFGVPVAAHSQQGGWIQQPPQAQGNFNNSQYSSNTAFQLTQEIAGGIGGLTASMGVLDQKSQGSQGFNLQQKQGQVTPSQPNPQLQPQLAPRPANNRQNTPAPPVLGPSQKNSILKPAQKSTAFPDRTPAPRHPTFGDDEVYEYSEEEEEPEIYEAPAANRVRRVAPPAQVHAVYAAPTYFSQTYNPVRRSVVLPPPVEYIPTAAHVYEAAPRYYTETPITAVAARPSYTRLAPRRSVVRSPVVIPAAREHILYDQDALITDRYAVEDPHIRVTSQGFGSASTGALRTRPLSSSRRIAPVTSGSTWTLGTESSSYAGQQVLAPGIFRRSHTSTSVPRASYGGGVTLHTDSRQVYL